MNVLRPFVIGDTDSKGGYFGMMPMIFNDFDSQTYSEYSKHAFIPKLKYNYSPSQTGDNYSPIDFRAEFEANNKNHVIVNLRRTDDYLYDVNDMPDRIYSYVSDGNDNPLYGMASGHSIVRGMGMKDFRNEMIPTDVHDGWMGWWNPEAGNKLYLPLMRKGDDGHVVTSGFIGMSEGYTCWYHPTDDIHTFYYKSGDGYVVYVHTKGAKTNGIATLPLWMNGMPVVSVIEKTNGISLDDDVVTNGNLHVTSVHNNVTGDYNYIVFQLANNALEINKKFDNVTFKDDPSPYNDEDVLRYFTDEDNKVFATLHKDGSITRLALTEQEQVDRLTLDKSEELQDYISISSPFNDEDVIKYFTDEGDRVFGYLRKDGTVVIYKGKILDVENPSGSSTDINQDYLVSNLRTLVSGIDSVKLSKIENSIQVFDKFFTSDKMEFGEVGNYRRKPIISIMDDDTLDLQIPSSYGTTDEDTPQRSGGYFSVLLPMMLSLGAKHHRKIAMNLACEGHRVGLTTFMTENDDYSELNFNGKAVKWLHDNMGWDVINHSMAAQVVPSGNSGVYHVPSITDDLANIILSRGTYDKPLSFNNTIVLDDSTGLWWEVRTVNGSNEWARRDPQKKYCMMYYYDYINQSNPSANHKGSLHFNRDFNFDYNWGEWFRRADLLGLPHENIIAFNGSTTTSFSISASRKYSRFCVSGKNPKVDSYYMGGQNMIPILCCVSRMNAIYNDGYGVEANNVSNPEYRQALEDAVDYCRDNNTWLGFTIHAYDTPAKNYYMDNYDYTNPDTYRAEWSVPLKKQEIIDMVNGQADYINTPPSRLRISTWDEWIPFNGTRLRDFYDVLDRALSNGIEIVTLSNGWEMFGDILDIGADMDGREYLLESQIVTLPTEEEKSYLTVGADLSIRYKHSV